MSATVTVNSVPALCVDAKRAAKMIGVSVWVLRRWIAEDLIPVLRFPSTKHAGEPSRRVLIAVRDLETFVATYRESGQ